jgi:hypothetical protein
MEEYRKREGTVARIRNLNVKSYVCSEFGTEVKTSTGTE